VVLQDGEAEGIRLHLPRGLEPRAVQTDVEAADAGEERAVSEDGITLLGVRACSASRRPASSAAPCPSRPPSPSSVEPPRVRATSEVVLPVLPADRHERPGLRVHQESHVVVTGPAWGPLGEVHFFNHHRRSGTSHTIFPA
jgi:hypothetical protein